MRLWEIRPLRAIITSDPERRAKLRHRDEFRHTLTGAPGLWAYFLVHSMQFLAPGGRLAFVTPGALAFADYAVPLLRELRRRFAHVEIGLVDGAIKWDGYASQRAALVLASGYECGPAASFSRRAVRVDDSEPVRPLVPTWTPIRKPTDFGEVARLEIGIVTGANDFYLLNCHTASTNEIPDDALRSIIARARHVRGLRFTGEDALAMATEGEKTLLFHPAELGPRKGPIRRDPARGIRKARRLSIYWLESDALGGVFSWADLAMPSSPT